MTIPPEETREESIPRSGGRVLTPAGMPWARDGRPPLVLAPTVDPCPTLAPTGTCACCGKTGAEIRVRWKPPAPPSSELDLSRLRALVDSYLLCADTAACFDRRRAAEAAQEAAAASPAPAPAPVPAKAASRGASRARRPSQARKTLLGAAARTARATPKNPAVSPADSAPGGTAAPPHAGGAT